MTATPQAAPAVASDAMGLGPRVADMARACVEFFFPRLCHVCLNRLAPSDEIICDRCRADLVPPRGPVCPWCGAGDAKIEDERCRACPKPRHFDAARGAVAYTDTARALVHELKFAGHVELAPVMARRCYRVLEDDWAFEAPDMIVPVPLHETRFQLRGFNQAMEIAKELERLTRIPLNPQALERVRPTQAQSSLGPNERRGNVRGAFFSDRNADVAARDILLVDDVMTSSATINECARVLKEAGAARVLALVFARAA